MTAKPARRNWRHWSMLVPLATLSAFGIALLVHEPRPPRTISIQLTPPAQAELTEIPLPARVRAVEGRVVDARGEAMAGALVWVLSGDEPRWTNADASGAFRLQGLQRGPWDVRVLAHDHRPHSVVLRDTGAAQEVRLPDGPRVAPVVPALQRARLVGTLIGTALQETRGAEVALTPTAAPESFDAPLPRRAIADAGGRFQFDELIAGEYRVTVIPDWARGGTWPDLARASATAEPILFVHRADGSAPLSIDISAGSVVGSLLDDEGDSLEGAFVLVTPSDRPDRPWPPVATDARGQFEFRGLPPGRYALTARAGNASFERAFEIAPRMRADLGIVPAVAAK